MSFGFLSFSFLSFSFIFSVNWSYTVTQRTFLPPVRVGMLYWGELNSTEKDSTQQKVEDAFHGMFRGTRITDGSIRDGLAAFLQEPSGNVAVVKSHTRIYLKTKHITLISSGKEHVVLVSETGTVYEWKCSAQSNIPRAFSRLHSRPIAQVACGNHHSIVLTKDGQLFTWGENSSGQLGLGKGEPSSLSPQPLKSLCGIPLAQISAGGDHSFALSLSGVAFGWGRNSAGQLGLGDTDDRHVPVCVKSLNLKKTVFISCGEDHTAVLTKGGLILTFGSGQYGQLGHNSLRDEHQPRLVAEFWGSKVSQISCGQHHTLALVESSNSLYSFGRGEQGQLGNGQRTNQCVPLPVQLTPEFRPDQIKKVTAGGNMSVIFISEKVGVQASSNVNSYNGPAVLEDEIIDRWISDCKPKAWKKFTREIKKMFSSASSINGSFIDKSSATHYKTLGGTSGLDLSLARLAFEKLAKNDKVLSLIEKTVENDLLPTLGSTAAGVEALRVYLILPELLRVLRKQGRGTQLTISLASSILKLEPETMEVLASLWTKLPYYYYRTLVTMFNSMCTHYISLMASTICDHWTEVKPLLKVLKKLYNVNSQRVVQLAEGSFLVGDLTDVLNFDVSLIICNIEKCHITSYFLLNANLLACHSFILDMNSKCALFRVLQDLTKCHLVTLCVNRERLLADTLVHLKTNRHNFSPYIKVKFALEDGIDYGALRAEFFTLLGQEIAKDCNVIQASEDSGLFWFSADDTDTSQEELFYIGVICGMAFYNSNFMYIGFPVALFKKLLNIRPTFRDLEELSPVEARSLKNLLMEDEDVVELFCLDFTVKGQELVPNGAKIPVTKANRQKYVDLYVDFVFNKSVENQFQKFEEGFSHGYPYNTWKLFKPEELRDLLYGMSKYEWKELQQGVTYECCKPSDELIQNFWSVFFELDEEHQKKFLTFVHGTDRLPVGGLSKLRLKIARHHYEDSDDRFPSAQTCFGVLRLPNYSSVQILREKLIHAITYCEVFGQE